MKKIRIIIDVVMYIIFIILMGHHITGNLIHEILGTGIILLFIIHNLLNIRFYKVIFKGKYNFKRLFLTLIDILLLFSMIGIIISSMIISNNVFAFLNIQTTSFGLKLHMLRTSWWFIAMSIHLGLHLNALISKINKKMKNSTFEYIKNLKEVFGENLGENSVVNTPIQGVCIDRIKIGKNVFINSNALFMARGGITIEDDVQIAAAGASIMPGICIGKRAIVGATSVVTHDVPDYAVVVGNPARVIKTLDETKFDREEK